MSLKPTIAFGPEINRPSWDWVGFDMSRELSKYFNIVFFSPGVNIPQADLVCFIKIKPDYRIWLDATSRSIKMVYCPIDNYADPMEINENKCFLGKCDAILLHCERLVPFFESFAKKIEFVEHHNRFGLPEPRSYSKNGYVVWIGGFEHLPRVIRWLQDHPLQQEIKFVTNYTTVLKDNLKDVLPIEDKHELIKWYPRSQFETMSGAKGAFDIKGLDFDQMHKPPVKAQQFIASGIPFATNAESYSCEYFAARGLQLPSPMDVSYWFSKCYWSKIQTVGRDLRKTLSIEKVGLHYRQIFEKILGKA